MNNILKYLRQIGACREALDWIGDRTAQQAWDSCPCGDWMLWAWSQIKPEPRQPIVLAACECARLALPYSQGDDAPRVCIETVEAWCRGEASIEHVKETRARLLPNSWAMSFTTVRTTWAARAAADAVEALSSNGLALSVNHSVRDAAAAFAGTAAENDLEFQNALRQCAEIVRSRQSDSPWH